jgi:hypothetical protein
VREFAKGMVDFAMGAFEIRHVLNLRESEEIGTKTERQRERQRERN